MIDQANILRFMQVVAQQFVDEGLFGEIPGSLTHYSDLEMGYSEVEIAGTRLTYRCGQKNGRLSCGNRP